MLLAALLAASLPAAAAEKGSAAGEIGPAVGGEAPGFGVAPHPAALVIDRNRVIRYKRVDVDHRVRPRAAELVEAVRGLEKGE